MTTPSTSLTAFSIDAGQRARLGRAAQGAVLISRVARHVAQVFRFARGRFRVWNMRLDDREFLAGLHDHQLGEMGMTLDQRDREIRKPFWEG